MRALRVDKMTYAALEATLFEYAVARAATTVPVQHMLALTVDVLRLRASTVANALNAHQGWTARIVDGVSAIGGGSAPGIGLPTALVAISRQGLTADALDERLRALTPPVVGRIAEDRVVLDLRTVADDADALLTRALMSMP